MARRMPVKIWVVKHMPDKNPKLQSSCVVGVG